MIPFGQATIGEPERNNVLNCIETSRLTMGHWVAEFEHRFADYIGVEHAAMR